MSELNAFVNPVVRGVINPNKTITYKKELHFDSCFRDNYGAANTSASSFLYNLPEEIDNVVSLRLSSIVIPCIPITISKTNNLFCISDTNGIKETVKITDGIYTHSKLVHTINSSITAKGIQGITFKVSSNNKEQTTIENTSVDSKKITFYEPENCTNFMDTLGWLLGFRKAHITITKDSPPVTSSGLFENNFTDYLYFSADDFQRNVTDNNIVYLNKTTINNNILGKIYRSPDCGIYCLNTKNSSTSYETNHNRIYFGPVRLSKFRFSLLDKFGKLVDMSDMDYSFTLEVEVLYDRNNVTIPC